MRLRRPVEVMVVCYLCRQVYQPDKDVKAELRNWPLPVYRDFCWNCRHRMDAIFEASFIENYWYRQAYCRNRGIPEVN
jgi:uncharacterized protein YlaI